MAHQAYQQRQPGVAEFPLLLLIVAVVHQWLEHHRQRVLYGGYAARGVEVALLLACQRMRRVVGGYGVNQSVIECCPQSHAVFVALDGGVALDEVAQLCIVAVVEPQVVGCHLGSDMLLVEGQVAQQVELGGGADVGNMQSRLVATCALYGLVGAHIAGLGGAYLRVQRCGFALCAGTFHLEIAQVGLHDVLLFAVGNDKLLGLREKQVECLRIVDQHIACAAAEEKLDGRILCRVGLEYVVDIAVGGTEHKAVVGDALFGRQRDFLFQQFHRCRLRLGVWHIDERCHASCHSCTALALNVGLLGQPRLAEMHVSVNNSGQKQQTCCFYCILNFEL